MELLGIGEAARRLGVHPMTLVLWEKRGIVSPERDSSGRRIFLGEDIARLKKEREASKESPAKRFGR